ncbi:ABC transporter permease [Mycolicibacterium cosmeticum]|uniref:ABC transporter permease n=1 Tax=Mycolicibacterium cosmeticum TaxID=258533 RepID=UPI0032049E6E
MATQSVPRHAGAAGHRPSAAGRAAGLVLVLTAALAVLAVAFALPAAKSRPHDIPIGIAGPQAATGQVARALEQRAPGAFDVTYYPGEQALREAIRDRQVYGGVSFGPEPTVFTATGASPVVAQLLGQIGAGLAQQTGHAPPTEDLAPPTAQDPRGAGLAAAALPITLAGILPAIALVLLVPGARWTALTAAVGFAGLMGLTVALLLRYVLGSIEDNLWGVAAGLALGVLAALLVMLGLGTMFGKVGLATGAALALLVGNPLSGLTSAPEMLPGGWGTVGQLLPQGATATLLRSTAYFAGSGAAMAIAVLTCWAVAGLVLLLAAGLRKS